MEWQYGWLIKPNSLHFVLYAMDSAVNMSLYPYWMLLDIDHVSWMYVIDQMSAYWFLRRNIRALLINGIADLYIDLTSVRWLNLNALKMIQIYTQMLSVKQDTSKGAKTQLPKEDVPMFQAVPVISLSCWSNFLTFRMPTRTCALKSANRVYATMAGT